MGEDLSVAAGMRMPRGRSRFLRSPHEHSLRRHPVVGAWSGAVATDDVGVRAAPIRGYAWELADSPSIDDLDINAAGLASGRLASR